MFNLFMWRDFAKLLEPRAVAAAVACAVAPVLQAAGPVQIELVTDDYPPFQIPSEAGVSGISADVVLELFRRTRQPYSLNVYPWARALAMARNQPMTCLFSVARLPERETQFKWIGPISQNYWAFYARADFPHRLHNLEDARPFVIGGYLRDAKAEYLLGLGFNVDVAPTDQANPRKLAAGRIDLWVTGLYQGKLIADAEKVSDLRPVLSFRRSDLYLGCHPSVDDAVVETLRRQLRTMEEDGSAERMRQRYVPAAR